MILAATQQIAVQSHHGLGLGMLGAGILLASWTMNYLWRTSGNIREQ